MKSLILFVTLMVSGSAIAAQTTNSQNYNMASCCDDCYYTKHSPGSVPCHPGLSKSGVATYTAPTSGGGYKAVSAGSVDTSVPNKP